MTQQGLDFSPPVMREITPLSERDCFYIADRHKSAFDYPIHCHPEFELNYIERGAGVRRTVGDNTETIGDLDMVLIAGSELEHVWEQGSCTGTDIREITIQFSADILPEALLRRNQFDSIRSMLERAQCGLAFPVPTIMRVYSKLDSLISHQKGFGAVLEFFGILYELSLSEDARQLSSSAFARAATHSESRRVAKVQEYITRHFHDDIRAEQLADLIGMSPVSFSRFFRQRTGRTLTNYVIDLRIGTAARMLVDSEQTVAEICYDCGFNTLSNFNRLFRKYKGCSPTEFRESYHKKKVIV